VAFSNQQSYIAAISARFVQLQHGDIDKRVSHWLFFLHLPICNLCFIYYEVFCGFSGWSEAIRFGRPAMWWMSWRSVCWEIRAIFLRKRDVSAVLLWTVLGYHTFQTRAGISQAAGQGRCGQTTNCPIQMVNKSINNWSSKAFYCLSNCYGDYLIRNGVFKENRNFTFLVVVNREKK